MAEHLLKRRKHFSQSVMVLLLFQKLVKLILSKSENKQCLLL